MKKSLKHDGVKKRANIQLHFWNEVGSVEHISIRRIEDAIRREFNTDGDRLVRAQINLMQTEQRIRIESKVKVWILQPRIAEK